MKVGKGRREQKIVPQSETNIQHGQRREKNKPRKDWPRHRRETRLQCHRSIREFQGQLAKMSNDLKDSITLHDKEINGDHHPVKFSDCSGLSDFNIL